MISGSLPPPNLMVSPSSLATSISLTWAHPQGGEAVDGYEITYTFQINECVREGNTAPVSPTMVILNNGPQRSYTIMNSSDTLVEEDSDYTITITAVNSVGRSAPSNIASTSTAQAGNVFLEISTITVYWEPSTEMCGVILRVAII